MWASTGAGLSIFIDLATATSLPYVVVHAAGEHYGKLWFAREKRGKRIE